MDSTAVLDDVVRILVVEDDEGHIELVRRNLEGRVGRELRIARTIAEARGLSRDSPPDLVIADLGMPDGSALDLLEQDAERRAWPTVIMTAQGDERAAVAAMKAGAIDYVAKSESTFADMPRIAERALREWGLIREKRRFERERKAWVKSLRSALAQVKTLSGLLPICAWCKKIRDDDGYWTKIESYIRDHSEAEFTHCVCPTCRVQFENESLEETQ